MSNLKVGDSFHILEITRDAYHPNTKGKWAIDLGGLTTPISVPGVIHCNYNSDNTRKVGRLTITGLK